MGRLLPNSRQGLQRRQQLLELLGVLRILARACLPINHLAGLKLLGPSFDKIGENLIFVWSGGRVGKWPNHSIPPKGRTNFQKPNSKNQQKKPIRNVKDWNFVLGIWFLE